VSLFPPNHNLFMSGSRDFSVRVWDRRAERCVGELLCSTYFSVDLLLEGNNFVIDDWIFLEKLLFIFNYV
jgi:WD40 repeat protein